MLDTLAEQIEALPKMNRGQLQAKWLAILRQPAPSHLRKELLVPLLAYKLHLVRAAVLRAEAEPVQDEKFIESRIGFIHGRLLCPAARFCHNSQSDTT